MNDKSIEQEINGMKSVIIDNRIENNNKRISNWSHFTITSARKALSIGIVLWVQYTCNGYIAMILYTANIF